MGGTYLQRRATPTASRLDEERSRFFYASYDVAINKQIEQQMECILNLHNCQRRYSMNSRAIQIIMSLGILFFGGLIYIIYRDKSLLMFDWFNAIGINNQIDSLRSLFQGEGIYGWVKYSLPDGLWIFSYMFLVDAIWDGKTNSISNLFLWCLPIVAVLSECLQCFGVFPGVFDWMDMASYIFAIILFLIIKLIK